MLSNYLRMKPQRAQWVAGFAVGGTSARRVHRHLRLLLLFFPFSSTFFSVTQKSPPINICFSAPKSGAGGSLNQSQQVRVQLIQYKAASLPPPRIRSVLRGQSSNNGSGGGMQAALHSTFARRRPRSSTAEAGSSEVRPSVRGEERRRWNFTTSP